MDDAKRSGTNWALLALIVVAAIALAGFSATAVARSSNSSSRRNNSSSPRAGGTAGRGVQGRGRRHRHLIPRPTLDAMSPVSTLEVEELAYRGVTRMEDMLTALPQVFASQTRSSPTARPAPQPSTCATSARCARWS